MIGKWLKYLLVYGTSMLDLEWIQRILAPENRGLESQVGRRTKR